MGCFQYFTCGTDSHPHVRELCHGHLGWNTRCETECGFLRVIAELIAWRYALTFRDNAQSPLCSYEKLGSIESCSRFTSSSARLDNFPRRQNDSLGDELYSNMVLRKTTTHEVEKPFCLCCSISDSICYMA